MCKNLFSYSMVVAPGQQSFLLTSFKNDLNPGRCWRACIERIKLQKGEQALVEKRLRSLLKGIQERLSTKKIDHWNGDARPIGLWKCMEYGTNAQKVEYDQKLREKEMEFHLKGLKMQPKEMKFFVENSEGN
uniref:Ovule protein n=1 Tax=Angiostrongylus cantonensis TaxID=6313 RepID=A0A0K0DHE5_ANGCA